MEFKVKQGLNDAICLTDSFVFLPGHCVNFKFESSQNDSTSFDRIKANKSQCVTRVLTLKGLRGVILTPDSPQVFSR